MPVVGTIAGAVYFIFAVVVAVLPCYLLGLGCPYCNCWGDGQVSCDHCDYDEESFGYYDVLSSPCDDFYQKIIDSEALIIGGDSLPANLQGLFWLTEQEGSSSIMSFAGSDDGAPFSTGALTEDDTYQIKIAGDRIWSYKDPEDFNWRWFAPYLGLSYEFLFNDATDPTYANIIVTPLSGRAKNLFPNGIPQSIMGFDMYTTPHHIYPNSVNWFRNTSVFTIPSADSSYNLVQVVSANGSKLEPAFTNWQHECHQYGGNVYWHKLAAQ